MLQKIDDQVGSSKDEDRLTAIKSKVAEFYKRYEAQYSTAALMTNGVKKNPFPGCSNIGYPIEMITIQALIPRIIKVIATAPMVRALRKMGRDPKQVDLDFIKKMTPEYAKKIEQDIAQGGPIDDDKIISGFWEAVQDDSKMVTEFLNSQAVNDEFGFEWPSKKETTALIALIEGTCIDKITWETRTVSEHRYIISLVDSKTGDYIKYNVETDDDGRPIKVPVALDPDEAEEMAKASNGAHEVSEFVDKKSTIVRNGPKIEPKSLTQFIYPIGEKREDPDEWEWLEECDTLTYAEIRERIGNPRLGDFDKDQVALLSEKLNKNADNQIDLHQPVKIRMWYGKEDVDNDGKLEDIIVWIAKEHDIILGWMFLPFSRRPFFNTTPFPHPNRLRGMSVPEIISSIRDMLDKIYNLSLDGTMMTYFPPHIFGRGAMVDAKAIRWGIGAKWMVHDVGQVKTVTVSTKDLQAINLTQLLIQIVQKLFGVSDYNLGSESDINKNPTATGIVSLIEEGNTKFDHIIKRFQMTNKKEFKFIHKLNFQNLDKGVEFRISGGEMPYGYLDKSIMAGEWDFDMFGNTVNTSDKLEQERALLMMNTFLPLSGQIKFIDDEFTRDVLVNFNRAFKTDYRIKTLEELKKEQIENMQLVKHKDEYDNGVKQLGEAVQSGQINPESAIVGKAQLDKKYPDVVNLYQEAEKK